MSDNRRYEYRLQADLTVIDMALPGPVSQPVSGFIRELSASGCRLESSMDLKVNQEIRLSFRLLGEHRVENVMGRIIRRLSQRTHKVVAVEFVDLSEQDQYRIREYIIWCEAQEAGS